MGVQSISNSGLGRRNAKRSLEGVTGLPWVPAAQAFFAHGYATSAYSNVIDTVLIATTGNATDFGDTTNLTYTAASCASVTRGITAGGAGSGAGTNVIQYVTLTTAGNAQSFGTLTQARQLLNGCNSSTRGVFFGGYLGSSTDSAVIDYVTIATTGNALSFGSLSTGRSYACAFSSPTRGVNMSGYRHSLGNNSNLIEYVTIATTGNATNFGTCTATTFSGGLSNSTRGLMAGGWNGSNLTNIEYVTIATTGNATTFGSLSVGRNTVHSGAASTVRGVWGGGYTNPGGGGSSVNIIDYVTIASTGNSVDFGDLTVAREGVSAFSNSNGGIG